MALSETLDLGKIIKEAVDSRVKEIADEEFANALKRIEERRDEVVTGTVLAIEKYVSYERMGQTLRIEIKEKTQ